MLSQLSNLSTKVQSRQNPFSFGSSSEGKNVQSQLSPHSITAINRCRPKLNVFLLWWKSTAFPLHCTCACHSTRFCIIKTMFQVMGSKQSLAPRGWLRKSWDPTCPFPTQKHPQHAFQVQVLDTNNVIIGKNRGSSSPCVWVTLPTSDEWNMKWETHGPQSKLLI